MTRPYIKQEPTSLNGLDSQYFRDEVYKVIASLNAKLSSGSYQPDKSHDNVATFTGGQHKAFSTKTNDFIDAIAGATVDVPITFDSKVNRINNIHFKDEVNLSATSAIIFNACRFDKPINIDSGGQAQFLGCTFRDSAYVNNAGIAPSVYVNGCIRTSIVHINVTVISETIA